MAILAMAGPSVARPCCFRMAMLISPHGFVFRRRSLCFNNLTALILHFACCIAILAMARRAPPGPCCFRMAMCSPARLHGFVFRRRFLCFNNLTALILHFCLWHHPWPMARHGRDAVQPSADGLFSITSWLSSSFLPHWQCHPTAS